MLKVDQSEMVKNTSVQLSLNKEQYTHFVNSQNFQNKYDNIPSYLFLEISSVCNAKCIFCPYRFNKRKKAIIKDEIFYEAVSQYKEMGGKRIDLTPMQGEPFIDKTIINKIRYINTFGFENVHIYTNAILLHTFDLDELLDAGLTSISISTSVPDQESFLKTFGVDKYSFVINNISNLLNVFSPTTSFGT